MFECFDLNVDKGTIHIVPQIDYFEGPLQCSPTKRRCHPSVRNRVPTIERATNVRGKSTSKNETTTHDSVGVGEESMYSDTDSLVAASDSSYDTNLATSSDSNSLMMKALTLSLTLMVKKLMLMMSFTVPRFHMMLMLHVLMLMKSFQMLISANYLRLHTILY